VARRMPVAVHATGLTGAHATCKAVI
jgi:hypothetical protein